MRSDTYARRRRGHFWNDLNVPSDQIHLQTNSHTSAIRDRVGITLENDAQPRSQSLESQMKALVIKPHSGLARSEGRRSTVKSASVLCETHGLANSIESTYHLHQERATAVVRQEMPLKRGVEALRENIAEWRLRVETSPTWILGSAGAGKAAVSRAIVELKERSLAKYFRRMSSGKDKQVLTEENASMAERFKNSFSRKNAETDIVDCTWYVTPSRCAGKLYSYDSSQGYHHHPGTSAVHKFLARVWLRISTCKISGPETFNR